jgi:methanogenic corrinoid protein MtbC1
MLQKLLIPLVPLLTLTACLNQANDPRKVAEQYWQAMKNGDTKIARTLVSKTSQQDYDNYMALTPDERISIGEISLGTEQTTIATTLYPDTTVPEDYTTFDTVLVLENGKWKIDASQTTIPGPVPSDRELNELADELSESMQDNIDSMEDAMNEGLQILDKALREGSRDLGESMLKGMEEMNRALRESIEDMQKRREQQQSDPEGEGEGLI